MLPKRHQPLMIGLSIVVLVGIVSWYLGGIITTLGGVTIAILLGILVGNALNSFPPIISGAVFAEKKLLPIAIAFLGVELQLATLAELGFPAVIVILISMATAFFVSVQLGKFFGFSRKFSLLMGAGNAVCGSSAVAATSLAIDADEADIGISISIVNLLGTIGIFLVPTLIQFLTLVDLQGGLLIGGTLQAVGQVVAAGFSVNDNVGNIATVVKMGRILMLGPVIIAIGLWLQSQVATPQSQASRQVTIPRFIIGFFIMSVLASLNVFPPDILSSIKTVGKLLLIVSMAGIGMRIQLKTLFQSGVRSLAYGGTIWMMQIGATLAAIMLIT